MAVDIPAQGRKRRLPTDVFFKVGQWKFMSDMTPGDFIRRHRNAKKMTQEGLGEAVGVTRVYVNQIENARTSTGEAPNVSDELLYNLSKVLDVSEAEMFTVFDRPMVVTDPDLKTVVEAYRGASETGRRGILTAAEQAREAAALRAARAGSIGGKRAE